LFCPFIWSDIVTTISHEWLEQFYKTDLPLVMTWWHSGSQRPSTQGRRDQFCEHLYLM